jgi:hypothetical protein
VELNAEQLSKSGFDAALNSTFLVSMADQPESSHSFTLKEVKNRSAPPGFEQFSLLFLGAIEPLLPQGTYIFAHANLGELPLFTVPIGKNREGVQYEVCISRSTEHD